jgi:hypothetical protein
MIKRFKFLLNMNFQRLRILGHSLLEFLKFIFGNFIRPLKRIYLYCFLSINLSIFSFLTILFS